MNKELDENQKRKEVVEKTVTGIYDDLLSNFSPEEQKIVLYLTKEKLDNHYKEVIVKKEQELELAKQDHENFN